jgi:hypothetical protein
MASKSAADQRAVTGRAGRSKEWRFVASHNSISNPNSGTVAQKPLPTGKSVGSSREFRGVNSRLGDSTSWCQGRFQLACRAASRRYVGLRSRDALSAFRGLCGEKGFEASVAIGGKPVQDHKGRFITGNIGGGRQDARRRLSLGTPRHRPCRSEHCAPASGLQHAGSDRLSAIGRG